VSIDGIERSTAESAALAGALAISSSSVKAFLTFGGRWQQECVVFGSGKQIVIKQDDELDKLEEDIRRLKNRYDQFFAGINKVLPSFERRQVETAIHEISKQKIRDKTRRFRLSTIVSRFNQYRELWGRKMRELEEGPLDFRRRQAAMSAPGPRIPDPEPPRAEAARVTSGAPDPYVRMTPNGNGEQIRALLAEIERENQRLGKASSLTVDQLAAMVQKQSEIVRAKYHVNTVAFRVETVDGKVKLKAKPLQD
jgi:hypothetical protein